MTNILILSAGTRNKIVRYFKEEIGGRGRVVAADCSNLAPALYEADKAYLVPRITEDGYLERVLEICEEEKITGVFSLIDPELSLIAKEAEGFRAIGTEPVVSPYALCETCLDKYEMYRMLCKKKIRTARCYIRPEDFFQAKEAGEIAYPVFVKPRRGSASLNINKVSSDGEIRTLFSVYDDLMIQEYMSGEEYGADAYVDLLSGKCTEVFLKRKLKMRAGETDKSVSVINEAVLGRIAEFAEDCGFRGMIDLDLFQDNNEWYLSEVNPRFGGGYPHAYACGVNLPAALLRNLNGQANEPRLGQYRAGVYMMKYVETMFLSEREIGAIV